MKKYVIFLLILGLFLVGTTSVKAVSLNDLQNEIKSLSEQISILKNQLVGQVLSSRTATIAPTTVVPATTVLTKGVKSTEVAQIQTALRNQGYTITADGSFGAKTEEAVKAFQASKGLSVTGKVDSQTRNSLINNSVQTKSTTVACDPNADGAPWIKVISPNGGETFTVGQQITITWQSCYMPANPRMNIMIVNSNGTVVDERTDILVGSSQSIQYTLGGNYALGSIVNGSYKVWINFKDNSAQDYSDNLFTINSGTTSNDLVVTPVSTNVRSWTIGQEPSTTQLGMFNIIYKVKNNSSTAIHIPRTNSSTSWSGQVTIENTTVGNWGYGMTDLLTSDAGITADGYNYVILAGQEKIFSYTADVSVSPSSMVRMKMGGLIYKHQADPTYSVKSIIPPIYTSYVYLSN